MLECNYCFVFDEMMQGGLTPTPELLRCPVAKESTVQLYALNLFHACNFVTLDHVKASRHSIKAWTQAGHASSLPRFES
jgi:hypothetical protein